MHAGVDALDARARVRGVGAHAHLRAGERARRAGRGAGSPSRAARSSSARRSRRARRTRAGRGASPPSSFASATSAVGLARSSPRPPPPRRCPALHRVDHAPRDVPDPLGVADARAAVFLDDQSHATPSGGNGWGVSGNAPRERRRAREGRARFHERLAGRRACAQRSINFKISTALSRSGSSPAIASAYRNDSPIRTSA